MAETGHDDESKRERIPTAEEVHAIFKELINGEYKETLKLEDEKGLYALEIEVQGSGEGETSEFLYVRKGRHKSGHQSSENSIDVVYYKDGMPISGTQVAKCVDGAWEIL